MTGLPTFATSKVLIAIPAAAVAVLGVTVGLVALSQSDGGGPGTVGGEATSAAATSPLSPRTSRLVPKPAAPEVTGLLEVSGPACDAAVINSDLRFPRSGARILDCRSGWAVMGAAISGDPYLVVFSDGRWRRPGDVALRSGACADEAISRGAPAWMAVKHLEDCRARDERRLMSRAAAPSEATRAPGPLPARPPVPPVAPPVWTSPWSGPPPDVIARPVTSPPRTSIAPLPIPKPTPTLVPTPTLTPTPTPTTPTETETSTSTEVPTTDPPLDGGPAEDAPAEDAESSTHVPTPDESTG